MPKKTIPLTKRNRRTREELFNKSSLPMKIVLWTGLIVGDNGKKPPLKEPPQGNSRAIQEDWRKSILGKAMGPKQRGSHRSSDSTSSKSNAAKHTHTPNEQADNQENQGVYPFLEVPVSTPPNLSDYLQRENMSTTEKVHGWQNKNESTPHAFYNNTKKAKKPVTAHHKEQDWQDRRADDSSSYTSSASSK